MCTNLFTFLTAQCAYSNILLICDDVEMVKYVDFIHSVIIFIPKTFITFVLKIAKLVLAKVKFLRICCNGFVILH